MGWKNALSKLAPTIAGTLGGPFASIAVKVVADKLGVEPSETALEEVLASGDSSQLLKLKEADSDLQTELKRLDIQDRGDARGLAKAKGILPQVALSIAYSVAYALVLYAFMSGQINVPESQQILFGTLIGILTSAQVQILNFWFGSSSGSKAKDK